MLFSCDFTVLPGHPPDLAADLDRLPAIKRRGHIFQDGARCNGGNAAIAGAVSGANIDIPTGGTDCHPDGGLSSGRLLLFMLSFRHGLLPFVMMEQFVASASWQFDWKYEGENSKPIMWFGLCGEKPEEGWILNLEDNSETEFKWKDFWFPSDPWLNRVPDADESYLAWMETECCSYLPSLEDILKTCPIEVRKQDDYETLTQKIEEYIRIKKGK